MRIRGENVREYLKKLRLKKKMTKQAVADFLGISQNYYTYIENGERQKSLDLVFTFCSCFAIQSTLTLNSSANFDA